MKMKANGVKFVKYITIGADLLMPIGRIVAPVDVDVSRVVQIDMNRGIK